MCFDLGPHIFLTKILYSTNNVFWWITAGEQLLMKSDKCKCTTKHLQEL